MIRQILTQARHELGLLRVLQECTVVPTALVILFALCGFAGVFER